MPWWGGGGVETRGEGETELISVLKLLVHYVPVLHDTCDFSLLFFNVRVCYAMYVIVFV